MSPVARRPFQTWQDLVDDVEAFHVNDIHSELVDLTYNVAGYGTVGDGVTDDSTVIQTALTALANAGGGVLYFPPGHDYFIHTKLLCPANVSIIFSGSGWSSRIIGDATTLIEFTGNTNIQVACKMRDMAVLVAGAQTGVKFAGTWSETGTSSLSFDHCYIHGTGTSTQVLVNYTGMANTTFMNRTIVTNNDSGNDCTALLCDGATSSVMGLRCDHSTFIAKRAVNLTGTGVPPNDVEGIWFDHGEVSGTTYGIRVGQSLAIGIDHVEFTGGGTPIFLAGANAHTIMDGNYMDVGNPNVPMINIQTNANASTQYTKIVNNHLYGGNTTGITGIVVDTTNAGFYNAVITGNDITSCDTAMDFSVGVTGGEFAINVISNNPLRACTTGIAMGSSSSKRVGNIITDNPVGADVTTFYTGQRFGNTVTNKNDPDQTWTPTITAGNAGAITTVSCAGHYHQLDEKHWWIQFIITMTINGSGGSYLICPLPSGMTGAAFGQSIFGFRSDSIGVFGSLGSGSTAINIQTVAGGYPGSNGTTITISGTVETA